MAPFFEDAWEKAPLHIPADDARRALYSSLFSTSALMDAAAERSAEGNPFLFGRDVVGARYADAKRATMDEPSPATPPQLQALMESGWSLQVHQPQRFIEPLWRLAAALECQFQCLVGINSYITPPQCQGFAPHFDDVELFIIQTEGRKSWKLHRQDGMLPNFPSSDLDGTGLGPPDLEVTLDPGDVLYLPRGAIHQAVAVADNSPSCHLTVSTYQKWTWGDLSQHAVGALLGSPALQIKLPALLTQGLPIGMFRGPTGHKSLERHAKTLTDALLQLSRVISSQSDQNQATQAAIDVMAEDFLAHRLPPHPEQLLPPGPPPRMSSLIKMRAAREFFHLSKLLDSKVSVGHPRDSALKSPGSKVVVEMEESVRLVSCLNNRREDHMLSGGGEDYDSESESEGCEDDDETGGKPHGTAGSCHALNGSPHEEESSDGEEDEEESLAENANDGTGLVFPYSLYPMIDEILEKASAAEGVRLRDIQLPPGDWPEGFQEQVALALWNFGCISTVEEVPPSSQAGKEEDREEGKAALQRKRRRRG